MITTSPLIICVLYEQVSSSKNFDAVRLFKTYLSYCIIAFLFEYFSDISFFNFEVNCNNLRTVRVRVNKKQTKKPTTMIEILKGFSKVEK